MQTGIIGLPGCGKSSLFAALTGRPPPESVKAAPVAVVSVPDKRVGVLAAFFPGTDTIYAEITFTDALHRRTHGELKLKRGELFSAAALGTLRPLDALAIVLGSFAEYAAARQLSAPDPHADLLAVETELALADLVVIEKRRERKDKEGARNDQEYGLLLKCQTHLENDQPLRTLELTQQEITMLLPFDLLSLKPALVLVNIEDEQLDTADEHVRPLEDFTSARGMQALAIAGKLESEIAQMDPADREEFSRELGLGGLARDRFIQTAYGALELISFLTIGSDEVKAWTIHRGDTALTAAGKVHSDIARGFIRAEVIPYDDLVEQQSEAAAKAAGKMHLEGKDYLVQDGDVIYFRFNV